MMTALEKGLDRLGYIEYDSNCSRPCQNRLVRDGSPLHSDLLFQDVCYPVGRACGSCGAFSHEDQGVSMHDLITEFIKGRKDANTSSTQSLSPPDIRLYSMIILRGAEIGGERGPLLDSAKTTSLGPA
eukprot:5999054-Pyramimonas_sp.AAC.2